MEEGGHLHHHQVVWRYDGMPGEKASRRGNGGGPSSLQQEEEGLPRPLHAAHASVFPGLR